MPPLSREDARSEGRARRIEHGGNIESVIAGGTRDSMGGADVAASDVESSMVKFQGAIKRWSGGKARKAEICDKAEQRPWLHLLLGRQIKAARGGDEARIQDLVATQR